MPNYRYLSRNELIRRFKEMKKGVSKKCLNCVGNDTRYRCDITDCGLYQFRPWAKESTTSK